jgi:hypothetical protein
MLPFRRPFLQTTASAVAYPNLPALSAAPLAVYGVTRQVAGYGGPCVRVQRVSDGAQADIGFWGNGLDIAAARSFAGGVALTPGVLLMVTDYDKSGNGQHATFMGRCFLISDRDTYGPAYADTPSISINSQKLTNQAAGSAQAAMAFPSTLSINAQAVADFAVLKPFTTTYRQMLTVLGASSGSARSTFYTSDGGGGGVTLGTTVSGSYAGKAAAYAFAPRANHQVVASVSKAGGAVSYLEDASSTAAGTVDSQTLTGGGFGVTTVSDYYAALDYKVRSLWPTSLTDAELSLIANAYQAAFGTAKKINRLVWAGSSTPMGQGTLSLGTTSQMQGYVNLLVGLLDRPVDLYNTAISGRQLTDCNSAAANEVDTLVLAGCNNIAVIDAGSNDAVNGADGPTIYGRIKTWVAARRSAGLNRIGVVTIKQRSDITGTNETNRQTANSSIRSGQADLGYDFLIDADALVVMQAPFAAGDIYMSPETGGSPFIHASPLGHSMLAQAGAAAVRSVLLNGTAPASIIAIKSAAVTLGALGLTSTSAAIGSPFSATITGRTTGSTLAATSSDGTSVSVSGSTVSGTFSAAGSPTITLTETLSGASNTPKSSTVSVTVSAAAPSAPAVGDVILIHPYDSRAGSPGSAAATEAGWNSYDQKTGGTLALINATGASTPLTAKLANGNMTSGNAGGKTTGNNSGAVPDDVLQSSVYADKTNATGFGTSTLIDLTISGLTTGTQWKVEVVGSRAVTSRVESVNVNGGTAQTFDVGNNTGIGTTFTSISPTSGGTIDVNVTQSGSETYCYLNAVRLTRTA